MCVGLLHEEELIRAVAQGVGNPIMAVGARTGRDGIHGASFASEDLSEASDAKRPRVQVGDPFTEKLLLEASLELIRSGHIVAIQDMGAAGLTSSSAEMAARGDVGVVDRHAQGAGARRRHDAVRDAAQRVAGAHARRRQGRPRGRRARHPREVGSHRRRDRRSDRRAGVSRRRRAIAWSPSSPAFGSSRTARCTSPKRARATTSAVVAPRTCTPSPSAPKKRIRSGRSSSCFPRRRSPASAGSTSSTTTPCAPAR